MEFDELANTDNGSCATLIVEGCTDDSYLEYWDYDLSDKTITTKENGLILIMVHVRIDCTRLYEF